MDRPDYYDVEKQMKWQIIEIVNIELENIWYQSFLWTMRKKTT